MNSVTTTTTQHQSLIDIIDGSWLKLRSIERLTRGIDRPQFVDMHAILFAMRGKARLTVDYDEHWLSPAAAILVKQGQSYSGENVDSEEVDLYVIRFEVREENGSVAVLPLPSLLPIADHEKLSEQIDALYRCWHDGTPLERLRAQSLFLASLYTLGKQKEHEHAVNARFSLDKSKAYIDEHYNETLTIDELARIAEISPKYYVDLFKKTYGLSTMDYVTEVRLNRAKELMVRSGANISEIAHLVGYRDEFYFSRRFKQSLGMSPTVYLKQRRRKFAAYTFPVIGYMLALDIMPYAAPLHPKWTAYYYKHYRSDIPLHLSAYRFNEDWELNINTLTEQGLDGIITLGTLSPEEKQRLERISPLLEITSTQDNWREQLRETAQLLDASGNVEAWLRQFDRKRRNLGELVRKQLGDSSVLAISVFKNQCYMNPTRGMKELLSDELALNMLVGTGAEQIRQPIGLEQIAALDADHIVLNVSREPETLHYWDSLQASSLWQDLKAVRRNHVYSVYSDPWNEYSAHAFERMLDDLYSRVCGYRPEQF